jgi:integrase
MARTIQDTQLGTRAARSRLKPRPKPYYRMIEEGLHLGYRKPRGRRGKPAASGKWVLRHYLGGQSYSVEAFATADDFMDADGVAILDFDQAQAEARQRMVSRAHGAAGVTGPLLVKDAVRQYLDWLAGERGEATVYDARRRAEAFIIPKLGDIECTQLTADALRRWRDGIARQAPRLRTAEGKKQQHREFNGDDADAIRRRRASTNRLLTILKAALNHAWREGQVPSDTAWRRVRPFKAVDAARVRYLTVAEAKRLINACDADFRLLVRAALATGCRYSELTRLQVRDFHPDSGTINVRQSKSGKPRHVVLAGEGIELFTHLSAGRAGDQLLLPNSRGAAWQKSEQARPMREACEHAKIKPRISFHILRHTYASHAVMNGAPLLVVARNLGHADTRMVEKHYGHLTQSYVADAIRAAAPQFGFKPGNLARLR